MFKKKHIFKSFIARNIKNIQAQKVRLTLKSQPCHVGNIYECVGVQKKILI